MLLALENATWTKASEDEQGYVGDVPTRCSEAYANKVAQQYQSQLAAQMHALAAALRSVKV